MAQGDPDRGVARRLAASYGRKSNPDDEAVDGQHLANAQRATRDGWRIPDDAQFRFGDDATSGKSTSRRDLDRLLEVLEQPDVPFDRLYISKKDRLSRAFDPRWRFWFEMHCKDRGVRVCYSDAKGDHPDYDTADQRELMGEFVIDAVDSVRAAEELKDILSRTRGGIRRRLRSGYFPGGWAPYGTERWLADRGTGQLLERVPPTGSIRRAGAAFRLAWNPEQLPVVRQIFDAIEDGVSLRRIAATLTARGVPRPGAARGGIASPMARWTPQDVWRIARNPIYVGRLLWGRTVRAYRGVTPVSHVGLSDEHALEPIEHASFIADPPISVAQFDRVQRALDGNAETHQRRRASRPEYLLSGLLACAACAEVLHGHTGPVRVRTGERERFYRHGPTRRAGAQRCEHTDRYLRAVDLEGAALAVAEQVLADDTLVRLTREEVARRLSDTGAEARQARLAELRALHAKKRRAATAASARDTEAESKAEQEEYRAIGRELRRQCEGLAQEIAVLEAEERQLTGAEALAVEAERRTADLRCLLHDASAASRKRVLALLVVGLRLDLGTRMLEIQVRSAPPLSGATS